jgi:D-proline reductase (dithiol) PrdB
MAGQRTKNRLIAKILTRFPVLVKLLSGLYKPLELEEIPWTPLRKALSDSTLAVVTTAGVHDKADKPFDMTDPNGDPTFREIDISKPLTDLMITHDYYDHTDADKDINIVFPIDRLREFEKEGTIGGLSGRHYGFMGHIMGPHIDTLMKITAPDVANRLKSDLVDIVLLTPG